MASSSSVSVFDNYRFKSAFNEELYNSIVKNKKVIAECYIDLDEDEYPEVKEQIILRGWRRLAAPKQEISIDLIHEFYANAILTEEEMEEAGGHTFRSYVREWSPQGYQDLSSEGSKKMKMRMSLCPRLRKEMKDKHMIMTTTTNQNMSITHDYEHPQPEFEHHQEFNEPPVQPPPYHVPNYTDQHQKDLDSIETQLQNMMWYQQQALENMSKNKAKYMVELRDIKGKQQELYENNDRFYNQVRQEQKEMVQQIQKIKNYQVNQTLVDSTRHKDYMDELAAMKAKQEEFFSNQANQYNLIRQDHKLLGKEILDVKKYQMSAVTMGSSGSGSSTQPPPPPPYEPDQALMKIREQHATFTEICRQLKDWTRNASGRECYTVWAHQLANPNLVELSSQKIVKQIYDNIDHKRPMFRGLLKSDLQPSDPTQPPS
ncbi:hypothetical protein PIB30_084335 [Stylosanthes scabra]|uniref:Uncharacterized protein n=1 Tax=Stylosanthes scabra TaxID=79078 RepID=A0ABU6YQ54_9FABA|nr:hypothetical protein [Stylosanthes scabra]